ncbi:hypothetical protein [Pseudomonas sp. SST3]|uniref:hypothetical protein n=1 Tax=Pseudomonas sp. SST3 TaxID=2267882 RepID=UPI000DFF1454|nr:hypothetical protein [Pseudomonas sp. SST3]NKQ11981.1 hypothetical protein [Pseudomonas sp. SST3]
MNIDIKHKHAGHLIVIEGQPFKANDAGQWDLTEIWRTLKLDKKKGPGKWAELKEAQRLAASGKVESSNGSKTLATKQAAIRYAAWVSSEFEDMVFDAFEAILEMPEVATVVIQKMAEMGREKSAELLARSAFNDKCNWKVLGRRTPKMLTAEQKLIQKYQRQANAEALKDRQQGREVC